MKETKVDNPSHKGPRVRIKGWFLSQLLRLQRLTWRAHIEGREHLDRLYAGNKRFLFCFWHGKYVPIFPLLEGSNACVVSSQSERGSIIAEICRNFGYQSVQIPDQARHGSLRLMEEALSGAQAGGIAVDGPLGPRHRVKSGVIRMASALGLDLLPVSVDSRKKIVFKKRWDRREIPLPFTKVCLVIGEPIEVPPELRSGQVRNLTDNLAETIAKLDKKAENMVRKNGTQKE
ncbi:MAG: DUF374 domain-containing protein [Deltaproteobacteria bacterium]|nr:DUF374 domain-containing protein [Deltaproteobacteria bacterium]